MNNIKFPVHLILALEDNVVTPEMILENIDWLKNVTVSTYLNASHCLYIDDLDSVINAFKNYITLNI